MFGNWATVFWNSKYGAAYFFSVILFAYWHFVSQSTIPSIDDHEVVVSMTNIDPVYRLGAKEAKDILGAIFYSMAPESLLIKPDVDRHGWQYFKLPNLNLESWQLNLKAGQPSDSEDIPRKLKSISI